MGAKTLPNWEIHFRLLAETVSALPVQRAQSSYRRVLYHCLRWGMSACWLIPVIHRRSERSELVGCLLNRTNLKLLAFHALSNACRTSLSSLTSKVEPERIPCLLVDGSWAMRSCPDHIDNPKYALVKLCDEIYYRRVGPHRYFCWPIICDHLDLRIQNWITEMKWSAAIGWSLHFEWHHHLFVNFRTF